MQNQILFQSIKGGKLSKNSKLIEAKKKVLNFFYNSQTRNKYTQARCVTKNCFTEVTYLMIVINQIL